MDELQRHFCIGVHDDRLAALRLVLHRAGCVVLVLLLVTLWACNNSGFMVVCFVESVPATSTDFTRLPRGDYVDESQFVVGHDVASGDLAFGYFYLQWRIRRSSGSGKMYRLLCFALLVPA